MGTPRFSKNDVRQELKGALLQFIRSTSWVLDPGAAYRLVGWTPPEDAMGGALCDVDCHDLDKIVNDERRELDIERFQVVRTLDEFYDYGVLGILRNDLGGMTGGTEQSFAYAFIYDLERSQLVFEMTGGSHFAFPKCLETARLAQARTILDGGERFFREDSDAPSELLAFREVALLANMEERSVRNAASGKSPALKVVTEEGKSYVAPRDALEWLSSRKGFVRSSAHGPLVDLDLSDRPFSNQWEVEEFIRQRSENLGISVQQYSEVAGLLLPKADENLRRSRFPLPQGADQIRAISRLLDLDAELLTLRLDELRLTEQAQQLRQSIDQLRARKQS